MQTNKKQNKKNFVRKNNAPKKFDKKNESVKAPEEKKITVIIVDDQYDFSNPEGALYVPGGEKIDGPIDNYVGKNLSKVNQIIWTRDAHKAKDKSFEVNGGTWPIHCVDGTPGAQLPDLYYKFMKMGIKSEIFNKGTDPNHEEYGAFEICVTYHHLHPNNKPQIKNCYFKNFDGTSGCRILNDDIVICGIAGDYCVKETIKNLLKHWRFNISVLMNGVASIDGGTALNELIEEKNLKKI